MFWAKTFAKETEEASLYPIESHALDTALMAQALWDLWLRAGLRSILTEALAPGSETTAKQKVALISALHDIGKINPVFQGQLDFSKFNGEAPELSCRVRGAVSPTVRRHERVGALHLIETNGGESYLSQPINGNWLALIIQGHHGLWQMQQDSARTRVMRNGQNHEWFDARTNLIKQLETDIGVQIEELPQECPTHVILLLTGFVIVADRLASETVNKKQERLTYTDCENAVRWSLGLFNSSFDPLSGFEPNTMQSLVMRERDRDGMCIISSATGSGKTEAALIRHLARPDERLMFFLPTRTTSNAMMKRMEHVFANVPMPASLTHSSAESQDFYQDNVPGVKENDEKTGLFPVAFSRHASAKLLAPLCVGTIDQALLSAMPLKWTALRLLALANAHIVIDEVHSLDEYQTTLLKTLLSWWAITDTRVTLLSATVPKKQFEVIVNGYTHIEKTDNNLGTVSFLDTSGQLTSSTDNSTVVPPIKFETIQDDEDAIMKLVLDKLRSDPQLRIGVFVNRVKKAQQIGIALREQQRNDFETFVLHSRMTDAHRRDVETKLIKLLGLNSIDGERGIVVVGTQVIESSLDIDFDMIITDLAPAPALIQRIGRYRRRTVRDEHRIQSGCFIAVPKSITETTARPYPQQLLQTTLSWLNSHNQIDATALLSECGGVAFEIMSTDKKAGRRSHRAIQSGEDRRIHFDKKWDRLRQFQQFTCDGVSASVAPTRFELEENVLLCTSCWRTKCECNKPFVAVPKKWRGPFVYDKFVGLTTL